MNLTAAQASLSGTARRVTNTTASNLAPGTAAGATPSRTKVSRGSAVVALSPSTLCGNTTALFRSAAGRRRSAHRPTGRVLELYADLSSSPGTSSEGVEDTSEKSHNDIYREMLIKQKVYVMQKKLDNYIYDPEDVEDYKLFTETFSLDAQEETIEHLMSDASDGTVKGFEMHLVPRFQTRETFWTRYFYQMWKIDPGFVKEPDAEEEEEEEEEWDEEAMEDPMERLAALEALEAERRAAAQRYANED